MKKSCLEDVFKLDIDEDIKKRVIDLLLKLKNLKIELLAIHYTKEEELFFQKMCKVWDFFTEYNDTEVFEIFLHTSEYEEYKEFFSNKNCYFERALDSTEALNIIAQDPENDILDLLSYNFSKNVYFQTASEIKELVHENVKTLVMVGCGPMPETIIHIAENTNIKKIIGIDLDPEAVLMAGCVIRKLGLSETVDIEYSSGEKFDYSNAEAVHIANFVQGKRSVLDRISQTAKDNCMVIARKSRELSNLAYEEIYPDLHHRLITKKIVDGPYDRFYVFQKFGLTTLSK